MTLAEFREQTKNLPETLNLAISITVYNKEGGYQGTVSVRPTKIKHYEAEENLKEILYLE